MKNQIVEDNQPDSPTPTNNDGLSINTIITAIIVLLPLVGTVIGMGILFSSGISSLELGLLVSLCILTVIGVEVGFHRHFSHHSFQTTTPIRAILTIFGLMAAQGGLVYWVIEHPRHHKYSDVSGDPHTPNLHGIGFKNQLRGLYHAHIGWIFEVLKSGDTDSSLLVKDLLKDPIIFRIDQLQLTWVVLGLLIPAILEGVITSSWIGAFKGFIWGGLVRIFLVQHFIWSTNSICHVYGSRPFKTNGFSTNNVWLAIPTFGQSWHNNHHTFPNSAITGLEWWQIDLGKWLIWILEKTGLVWDVKRPTANMIAARKLQT
uniref:Fatty-acid desaturase n=1 Tax=Anabaena sp. XPORK13A TaxID=1634053 RepID=A0A0U3C502_9NOST|nr:fatty-acid desaturase [Anabaena sp. XPORK13A]